MSAESPLIIVGAGLAGLIAAHAWPRASVMEAAPAPRFSHHALLRFRTEAVSRLTGIPFSRVLVRKGIHYNGRFVEPDVRYANWYTEKVLGSLARGADRSIWNIEPVERWVAPNDLYEQLLEAVASRVNFGTTYPYAAGSAAVVSTAPLDIVARSCGVNIGHLPPSLYTLKRAPITVHRFLMDDVHLHQTIYFPDPQLSLYRASITGNMLIMEHAGADVEVHASYIQMVLDAFGLRFDNPFSEVKALDSITQNYGKIAPIPEDERKRVLLELTMKHNVYSLGRFATWRNILLDDVVNDIDVIKRLLRSSAYEARRELS